LFDIILEKLKQIIASRLLPTAIIFIALFGVLISRLFTIQIVEGEVHSKEVTFKNVETREVKSTRGNIYDRNGILLAYNELTYSVVLEENAELVTNEQKNSMLYHLINILKEKKNTIENEFGISIDEEGKLYFNVEKSGELRFKKNAYGLRSVNDLNKEQKAETADEVFQYLRHGDSKYSTMFNISDEYSLEDALAIMTLRYAIFINYPKYNQIIISSGVSDETVAAIYENSIKLPGVVIQQQTKRVYKDSIYSSLILGYTGLINEAELESLQTESDYYTSSDVIGKKGIEKKFETYLSGTKGLETISTNSSGKFLEVLQRTDPVAGSDIYLTIDSDLQKAYYHIIEKNLAGLLLSKINNSTDAGTRGTSASDIRIPIYDVYYALINNNVIDINAFKDDDASNLEKQVYVKFLAKQEDVFSEIEDLLSINSTTVNSAASEEMQEYLSYIYSELAKKDINMLLSSNIDTTDSNYTAYINNKLSLSKFLQYAISSNWIDLTKLNIGDEYFSTDELYQKLLVYIKNMLLEDSTFHKKIYNNLVYSYKLSGSEICLLLFDQGVIKYNKNDVSKLENGTMSAYTFITKKIENLEITPAQLALEPCSASVIVTDVKTGDVIAMVSYPSYDNNKYANKIDSVYYNKTIHDLTEPWINRATEQKTAPGSTYKMVSAIAGLEEGVIGTSETILDLSTFNKITPGPKCWSTSSHGKVDVTTALEVSCNYFFYEVGWRLGLDNAGIYKNQIGINKIKKYATLLGLDRKSGIEVDEAEPSVSDEDAVRSAIGQGSNNYTPIQLSRYLTTIASSGISYDLTLIDKIVDKDGKVLLENSAKSTLLPGVKDSSWQLVQEGMYKVGNGSRSSSSNYFKNYPITIAGKTGTAQQSKSSANHALFVSYAPYDKPEIAVTVVIPNGYASSNAVELGRDIYSYYFKLEDPATLMNAPATLPDSSAPAFSD